jgi:hypothetical protein
MPLAMPCDDIIEVSCRSFLPDSALLAAARNVRSAFDTYTNLCSAAKISICYEWTSEASVGWAKARLRAVPTRSIRFKFVGNLADIAAQSRRHVPNQQIA